MKWLCLSRRATFKLNIRLVRCVYLFIGLCAFVIRLSHHSNREMALHAYDEDADAAGARAREIEQATS